MEKKLENEMKGRGILPSFGQLDWDKTSSGVMTTSTPKSTFDVIGQIKNSNPNFRWKKFHFLPTRQTIYQALSSITARENYRKKEIRTLCLLFFMFMTSLSKFPSVFSLMTNMKYIPPD